MPNTVNAGWLKDKNGDKFAPKTLTSQVQTSDGALIEDKIQADIDAAKEELAPLVGTTAEVTPAQVAEAVTSGRPVAITHTEAPFGSIQYCYFNVSEAMGVTLSTGVVDYIGGRIIIGLYGYIATGEWSLDASSVIAEKDDIPDAVVTPTSASVGQTIVVKAVDENGKPTAWESAYYQERTHWITSGMDTIIEPQTVTFGSDGMGAISGTLDIEAGKTYTVIWDGAEYICDCKTVYYSGMAVVYIGNPAVVGLDNNGLPFVIGKVLANGYTMAACLQPNTTHSVGIISATVNKIPERYMGDNEFVLHFEGDPNSDGGLSLKETADEIVAAIESGKRLRGELYSLDGGENRATMSDCTCFTLPAEGAVIITLSIGTLQWRGYSFAIDIGLSKAPDGTCLITDLSTARFENAKWYDHMTTCTTNATLGTATIGSLVLGNGA